MHSDIIKIQTNNHNQILQQISQHQDVILAFPLYVDSLPVTLLDFLKSWQKHPPRHQPVISCLVNCGFIVLHQMTVAVEMIQLFCKQKQLSFGSVLKIGSGEAILTTPFRGLVEKKIARFAKAIKNHKHQTLQVTMPLPKRIYVKASTGYWIRYGEKYHTSKKDMETMEIEKAD